MRIDAFTRFMQAKFYEKLAESRWRHRQMDALDPRYLRPRPSPQVGRELSGLRANPLLSDSSPFKCGHPMWSVERRPPSLPWIPLLYTQVDEPGVTIGVGGQGA